GFTVKELQGGTSNAPFSWQIVATRADTKNSAGEIVSKYVGVRLPDGPGPLTINATKQVTVANQIDNEIQKAPESSMNDVIRKPLNSTSTPEIGSTETRSESQSPSAVTGTEFNSNAPTKTSSSRN